MKDIVNLLKEEIEYFKRLKTAIGDIHGHIHSLAVKTAKVYLLEKHTNVKEWKVAEKYGSGIDIVGKDDTGDVVVAAEVKTTFRSKKETLGAPQRKKIKGDIEKLISSNSENKYLFVIDDKNKKAIKGILNGYRNSGIYLINIFDK